jgi:hypothetical protein
MKCPHCDGSGEIPDPNEKSPTKETSVAGTILSILLFGFLIFMVGGFLRDCANTRIGGGMCGLIGLEAVVPIGAMWLLRRSKQ